MLISLFVTGVAQLISKLNNKPFDESDETLFEVLQGVAILIMQCFFFFLTGTVLCCSFISFHIS